MTIEAADENTLALSFEGCDADAEQLGSMIRNVLISKGFEPWKSIEAEMFTYCGRTLVIARPAPPRIFSTAEYSPRLHRHFT